MSRSLLPTQRSSFYNIYTAGPHFMISPRAPQNTGSNSNMQSVHKVYGDNCRFNDSTFLLYVQSHCILADIHKLMTLYQLNSILKGWLTVFFLGLIVFMGCSLACVHACFFFKNALFFHIIYLYSTPLCPFSDKRLDLFPGFMKLLLQKYAMG